MHPAERLFPSYVELLCLEAANRTAVEYFDVSVGWVQQQQQKQLEQQLLEQQQQQLEQQQRRRERLRMMDERREQLQRRFLLEQATATAMSALW